MHLLGDSSKNLWFGAQSAKYLKKTRVITRKNPQLHWATIKLYVEHYHEGLQKWFDFVSFHDLRTNGPIFVIKDIKEMTKNVWNWKLLTIIWFLSIYSFIHLFIHFLFIIYLFYQSIHYFIINWFMCRCAEQYINYKYRCLTWTIENKSREFEEHFFRIIFYGLISQVFQQLHPQSIECMPPINVAHDVSWSMKMFVY